MSGGFGRFQWYVSVVLVLAFMTGGQIVYGLEFLEVFPEYTCMDVANPTGPWVECNHTYIYDQGKCKDTSFYKINKTEENYFENWVSPDKLNLLCVSDAVIGLIGSLYFVGFGISSLIVPSWSDKIGRKVPYMCSLLLQLFAYIAIFFSKDIYLTVVCYFIVGLCAGGRVAVGTTYLAELVPEEYENLVCTIINCGDSTIMIWQSIYYYFVPNWLYLHAYGVIAQVVMLVAVCVIPESPKFLYSHKKFNLAR